MFYINDDKNVKFFVELETLSSNLFIIILYSFHGRYFWASESSDAKINEEAKIDGMTMKQWEMLKINFERMWTENFCFSLVC